MLNGIELLFRPESRRQLVQSSQQSPWKFRKVPLKQTLLFLQTGHSFIIMRHLCAGPMLPSGLADTAQQRSPMRSPHCFIIITGKRHQEEVKWEGKASISEKHTYTLYTLTMCRTKLFLHCLERTTHTLTRLRYRWGTRQWVPLSFSFSGK